MNSPRHALVQGQRQLTRRSGALFRACTSATRAYTANATPPPSSSSSSSSSTAPKQTPIKFAPTASKWQKGPAPNKAAAAEPIAVPEELVYRPKTSTHWTPAAALAEASAQEAPAAVDWRASFHGIAARPVTEEQYAALTQPLDERDIEVKPDGVIYLPEIKYRRRLNESFGPMGWGIIPRGDAVVGDSVVTREYAMIVNGRFASQAQGENTYFGADQLPSAVEGCKSNALMRCCKDLGIASELWDPSFVRWFKKNRMEEVWVEHATTKKKRTLWYRKGAVEVAYPYRLSGAK